jgi:hypothetical protein
MMQDRTVSKPTPSREVMMTSDERGSYKPDTFAGRSRQLPGFSKGF